MACGAGPRAETVRYIDQVFPNVAVREAIRYGEGVAAGGATVALHLDIYEPEGDTAARRPAIVFAHGGGFIGGSRANGFARSFCRRFAARGYVAASIDYRLGLRSLSRASYTDAIYRAVQDARAAVRFLVENAPAYGIDPAVMFLGGASAGGVTALHAGYWGRDEMPAGIDTMALGGPGEWDASVRAIVNCWGAIGDTSWIDAGETPVVSVHGDQDAIVPAGEGGAYQIDALKLFGSIVVDSLARARGIRSALQLYEGVGHGHGAEGALMDSTAHFIARFLYPYVHGDDNAVVRRPLGRALRVSRQQPAVSLLPGRRIRHPAGARDLRGRRIPHAHAASVAVPVISRGAPGAGTNHLSD
jgi:acetyl esterase/lipase